MPRGALLPWPRHRAGPEGQRRQHWQARHPAARRCHRIESPLCHHLRLANEDCRFTTACFA
jgi:hypothetical protein